MIKSLLIFGSLQGFVFAGGLLTIKSPKNIWTNRLFSLLILTVSSFLLLNSQAEHFFEFPKFFLITYALIYLYCPLYHLFVQSTVSSQFTLNKRQLFNFFPVFLYLLVVSRWVLMPTKKILTLLGDGAHLDLTSIAIIAILSNLYLIWSSWKIRKQNTEGNVEFSRNWAFVFLNTSLIIANLAWLIVTIREFGLTDYLPPLRWSFVTTSMSLMIFTFGYFLVVNSSHFSVSQIVQNIKYRNIDLAKVETEELEQKILMTLRKNKPYKNAEFSLSELSNLCDSDRVKISYVLNNEMKTNFTELINKYRVEEFINLIQSNNYPHLSMLGVAHEAGFSSKSTFYKVFKEIKGKTPKEYFENIEMV